MEIACEMQTKTAKNINISSSSSNSSSDQFMDTKENWNSSSFYIVFLHDTHWLSLWNPNEIPIFSQHFLAPCGLEVCFDTSGSPEPKPGVAGDKGQGQTYALPKIGCLAMLVHIYIYIYIQDGAPQL